MQAGRKGGSQDRIVFAAAIALSLMFALWSPSFLDVGNLVSLVRNVSVLGVLALAMSIVVIGRGIDFAMVSTMVVSSAFFVTLYASGVSATSALLAGLLVAIVVGLLQGWLIAYADVPPMFATLAVGVAAFGFGQLFLVPQDVSTLPPGDQTFIPFGGLRPLGVPVQILVLLLAAAATHVFLRYTKFGRFIYASGENPAAARLMGIPTRVLGLSQYLLSATVAFVVGVITVSSVSSMSLRVVNSTMIYDVILVVVIGGVGLSGGKGGVRNVIAGTMLIGILLNGMTLMDIPYTAQNIIKGCILLLTLLADAYLNPRDEQTERQGDI